MNIHKVLIIEDELKVATFIKKGLEENDYITEISNNGEDGLNKALTGGFDLLILDLNIPKLSGFEVCKQVRQSNLQMPILMLTALSTTDDKLQGFESGADDYLVKPFEFRELIARVKSLLKRSKIEKKINKIYKIADLELDTTSKTVKRNNKNIELTLKEFMLLEYMMINENKLISRKEIAEKIWEINFDTGTNFVDVYINFLRKKIDKEHAVKLIHTQIGMGYIMKIK